MKGNLFKRLYVYMVQTNWFISIAAVCLGIASEVVAFGAPSGNYAVYLLLFFSTFFIYNFHLFRKAGLKEHNRSMELWARNNYLEIQRILLISGVMILFSSFFISFQQILYLSHLAVLALLYSIDFYVRGKAVSIRKWPLMKLFLIAYTWSSATVVFPLYSTADFTNVFLLFAERFIFIFALAIPFDIRDINEDKDQNVLTLPVLVGIKNSKLIACTLFSVFLILAFFQDALLFPAHILSAFLAVIMVLFAQPQKRQNFYAVSVDGVMIAHMCLILYFIY